MDKKLVLIQACIGVALVSLIFNNINPKILTFMVISFGSIGFASLTVYLQYLCEEKNGFKHNLKKRAITCSIYILILLIGTSLWYGHYYRELSSKEVDDMLLSIIQLLVFGTIVLTFVNALIRNAKQEGKILSDQFEYSEDDL